MNDAFVKLYHSILRSSVWAQPPAVKLAWVTLLIIADADGRVEGTIPGIAQIIGISVPEFEAALAVFLAPDRYSRTKDHEGRRLREIDGGWEILNHRLYREKRSPKQVRQAEWVAARRASTPVDMSTLSTPPSTETSTFAQRTEDRIDPPIAPLGEQSSDEAGANAPPPADAGAPSRASRSRSPRRKRRSAPQTPEVPLPDDWEPTPAHREFVRKHGLDLELEVAGFRGWAEGRTAISWNGTFTTRLANAVKFRRERGSPPPKRGAGATTFNAEDIA